MKPVDSFFSGLRGAFRPDDNTGAALLVAFALLLAAALLWLVRRRRRRLQSIVDDLHRFIAAHHLTLDDVETLDALATIAGERPLEVGTRLESFERSSAIALQGHPPTLVVRDGDFFARLRRLRQLLGFADLPNHFPLLTTRELAAGAAVDLEGAPAAVTDVNEAFWAVDSPSNLPAGAGAELEAAVVRSNDARYVFKCRLLATQALQRGHVLMLSHDEAPVRAQLREFVRISVSGTLRFRPPTPAGRKTAPVAPAFADVDGALVDVSLGGLAGHIATPLAAGSVGIASFAFADERYEGIEAVVLDCRPHAAGSFLLRLTFRKLPAADEQRLAAAITVHTARPL
ncbi:MAG TPA: PilZ domain-containing protein [Polyangia bacterium]|jgi:LPXTG-motif cell wall-anchored protein